MAPKGGQGEWEDVERRLAALPIRAYHIDKDTREGNPWWDMNWRGWGREENHREAMLPGMTERSVVRVQVCEWRRPGTGAPWELWWVCPPF